MNAWEDSAGQPINLDEVVDACYISCSVLAKEIEFNPKVKDDAKFLAQYKRSLEVMGVVRNRFELARDMARRKRMAQKIIPLRRKK